MSDSPIRFSLEGAVARIDLDDGKANAVSLRVVEDLHAALDRAEKEAGAVALIGRPGRFSAGFDLGAMKAGRDSMKTLVRAGADVMLRMAEAPLPIVAGCTGHALAAGGLLLLAADRRVGAEGAFKIGLNEVAIGMTLPWFAVELATERLSRRHLQRVVTQSEPYDPHGAVDAGFLDRVVAADELEAATLADAAQLAELPRASFSGTKRRVRGPMVAKARAGLDDDMASWGGPS